MPSRQTVFSAVLLSALLFPAATTSSFPQESGNPAGEDEEVSIQDNSFLIEEAYNQKKGVVQNIFNWVPIWDQEHGIRHRESDFLFTQEWPIFSQKHQFSYSIPLLKPNCHLMLETLALWNEDLLKEGTRRRQFEWEVSPGVRWAPYSKEDMQWVLGIAAPVWADENGDRHRK